MIGFDVKIAGDALLTDGLEGYNSISGIALVTFGFLFDCSDIWGAAEYTISTVWASAESIITTTWLSAEASITTTWTDLDGSGGIYGDC